MPPSRRKSAVRRFLPVVFLLALPCAAQARGSFDHYREITRAERAPADTAVSLAGARAVVAFSPNGGGPRLTVRAIGHRDCSGVGALAAIRAQPAVTHVPRDGGEPGAQALRLVQAIEQAPGFQQRLLRQIFGSVRAARPLAAQTHQPRSLSDQRLAEVISRDKPR